MLRKGLVAHLVLIAGIAVLVPARAAARSTRTSKASSSSSITETPRTQKRIARLRHTRATHATSRRRHRRSYERFYTSSYADDVTEGDVIAGEDPVVREG